MAVLKSTLAVPTIIILFTIVAVHSRFEFTNLKCTSFNKSALEIKKCFLKSINRTYKYASVSSHIYTLPVTDMTIQVQVFKRLNGYKPFLFNFTVDACLFLKGKRNKVTQFFYDTFAPPYSNISHPCPYNHDIFVELPITHINHLLDTVLPVPDGNYLIHSVYYSYGMKLMDLKAYMKIC